MSDKQTLEEENETTVINDDEKTITTAETDDFEASQSIKENAERVIDEYNKRRALNIMDVILILALLCFAVSNIFTTLRMNRIEKKVDDLASQTDANYKLQSVQLENAETNIIQLREELEVTVDQINGINDTIEYWRKQLEDKLDKKVKELDDKIEEVKISKEEKKKKEAAAQVAAAPNPSSNANADIGYNAPSGGGCLTPSSGIFWYGNQLETYYNLDMSVIVEVAHQNGIGGEYWIRSDGCKMLGDYIMLACNRDVHPYGSIVQTSLGAGISLDTGGFAAGNPYQVDIAVTW